MAGHVAGVRWWIQLAVGGLLQRLQGADSQRLRSVKYLVDGRDGRQPVRGGMSTSARPRLHQPTSNSMFAAGRVPAVGRRQLSTRPALLGRHPAVLPARTGLRQPDQAHPAVLPARTGLRQPDQALRLRPL